MPFWRPVNALLGTANLILREVEAHQPRAVVLCFGPDAAAYRTELYPAYHAEREAAMPEELPHQFADSRAFFEAFGWTVATSEDLEADDLLGSYAEGEAGAGGRAKPLGMTTIIGTALISAIRLSRIMLARPTSTQPAWVSLLPWSRYSTG